MEDRIEKKRRQLAERLARKQGKLPPKPEPEPPPPAPEPAPALEPAPTVSAKDAETADWLEGLAKKTDEIGIGSAIELLQIDEETAKSASDEVINVGEILIRPEPIPDLEEIEKAAYSEVPSGEIGPAAELAATADSGEIGPAPALTSDEGPAAELAATADSGEIGPAPALSSDEGPTAEYASTADSGEIGPAPALSESALLNTADSGEMGPAPATPEPEPVATADSGEIGPAPSVADSGEIGPAPAAPEPEPVETAPEPEPVETAASGEIGPAPSVAEEPAAPAEDDETELGPELAALLEEGPLKLDEIMGGLGLGDLGLGSTPAPAPEPGPEPEPEPSIPAPTLGGPILGADALADDFAAPAGSGMGAVISDAEILGAAAYDDVSFSERSGEIVPPKGPPPAPAAEVVGATDVIGGGGVSLGSEALGEGLEIPTSDMGAVTLAGADILGGDVFSSETVKVEPVSDSSTGSASDVGSGSGSDLLELPPDLESPPALPEPEIPVSVTPVRDASSPFEADDDAMVPLEVMQSSGLLDASNDDLIEEDPALAAMGVVPTPEIGFDNPGVQELSGTSSDFTSSDMVPESAIESASTDSTTSDFDLEAAVDGPAAASAATQTALPTPKDHWIPVICSGCAEESTVPRHFAGGIVRCKSCQATTTVPRPGGEAARPVARRKASKPPADPEFKRAVTIVLVLCLVCVVLLAVGLRMALK